MPEFLAGVGMIEEKQTDDTFEIDFDQLKAEIASNAGLILKSFPELPEKETSKENLLSYFSNNSDDIQKAQLVKILKNLKDKINTLNKRIQAGQAERQEILREKAILIKEIKRLRGESAKIKELSTKVGELEKRSQINQKNSEVLLNEKNKLVSTYNETLNELSRAKEESADSDQKYAQLYSNHTVLQIEKETLKKDLHNLNLKFSNKLAEKVKKIEQTFDKKVEYLRKQQDRVAQFSNEVMEESETPAWMVTYGDMVTLLLTFFILYYSIAAQNLMKFKDVIFGETENNIGLIELLDTMEIKTSLNEWTGFQKNSLLDDMEKVTSDQISLDSGQNKSRIVVRIPGRTLFRPGSADLDKAGWSSLTEVANIFKNYPDYKVNIQGHTDDLPMASATFPTNWELSAVRATAVLRFLNDKGIDPIRMTATGYADTFPLGPNTTAEERSKNRRVEFVLEKIN
jgi:chemotaxis protein MotB